MPENLAVEAPHDDAVTIGAISVLAFMLADVLHEGLGHALTALMTGTPTGVLSTVAWSSAYDSRRVAAGGTIINLIAGLAFWIALRSAKTSSIQLRYFFLLSCAFNLFTGTGYFFFSGVTNFGDWAVVIANTHPYWLWRVMLVVVGMASYYGAALLIAHGVARDVGIFPQPRTRLRRILFLPYFSAIAIAVASAALNPIGLALMWQSALPATAGANSGLLWLHNWIPSRIGPPEQPSALSRSYAWILTAVFCAVVFIFILGRGITLHR
jgi:hypothetical protein